MMAESIVENGSTVAQAALDIQAIDDMLVMQKVDAITRSQRFTATGRLRKNATLMDFINERLDKLIEERKNLKNESV